jgi:hypothetical protein
MKTFPEDPPPPTGHLGQELKGSLAGPEVGTFRERSAAEPHQGDPRKVMALGDHLRADEKVHVSRRTCPRIFWCDPFRVVVSRSMRAHRDLGEHFLDLVFQALGPDSEEKHTGEAHSGQRSGAGRA